MKRYLVLLVGKLLVQYLTQWRTLLAANFLSARHAPLIRITEEVGYPRTIKTPRSGDGGVDVVAIKGAEGVVIQCKSSSVEGRELGWEAVKDACRVHPLWVCSGNLDLAVSDCQMHQINFTEADIGL